MDFSGLKTFTCSIVRRIISNRVQPECAIYTIKGQLIATVQGTFHGNAGGLAGLASIEQTLPNGLYIYRLSGNGAAYTVKKMLLK